MLLRSMCTLPGPETCKSEWRGWGRRGRRTKDTRRLPLACGLFNTNHVTVRRAARLHYGAAHKHANTQRAEWTQTRRRREYTHSRARTAALIRRLVIIISERGREGVWGGEEKKRQTALRRQERTVETRLTGTCTEKVVRDHPLASL